MCGNLVTRQHKNAVVAVLEKDRAAHRCKHKERVPGLVDPHGGRGVHEEDLGARDVREGDILAFHSQSFSLPINVLEQQPSGGQVHICNNSSNKWRCCRYSSSGGGSGGFLLEGLEGKLLLGIQICLGLDNRLLQGLVLL